MPGAVMACGSAVITVHSVVSARTDANASRKTRAADRSVAFMAPPCGWGASESMTTTSAPPAAISGAAAWAALRPVRELRKPVLAAALARQVEQVPQRPHHVDVARVLARLGRGEHQLAPPGVADDVAVAREDVERGVLLSVLALAEVVVVVVVAGRRKQAQVLPAALPRDRADALDRRLRHDDEVDALPGVPRGAVQAVEPAGAHRAGLGHRRAVHVVVHDEAAVAPEELGHLHAAQGQRIVEVGSAFLELVVLGHRAAERHLAPERRDGLDVLAQLHFGLEQPVARGAVRLSLVGVVLLVQGLRRGLAFRGAAFRGLAPGLGHVGLLLIARPAVGAHDAVAVELDFEAPEVGAAQAGELPRGVEVGPPLEFLAVDLHGYAPA